VFNPAHVTGALVHSDIAGNPKMPVAEIQQFYTSEDDGQSLIRAAKSPLNLS